jgi:Rad3-related DNA helicase
LDINQIILLTISVIGWILVLYYFLKKRKMKGVLNILKGLLEDKEKNIKRLEKEINEYKNDSKVLQKEIEKLKELYPELDNENPNIVEFNSRSRQIEEEINTKKIFFEKFKGGFFSEKDSLTQFSRNVVYQISLNINNNNTGSFTLVNEQNPEYVRNKDIFLQKDFCEVRYDSYGTRSTIESITPGKVHLEEDKWIVDEKVKIEII